MSIPQNGTWQKSPLPKIKIDSGTPASKDKSQASSGLKKANHKGMLRQQPPTPMGRKVKCCRAFKSGEARAGRSRKKPSRAELFRQIAALKARMEAADAERSAVRDAASKLDDIVTSLASVASSAATLDAMSAKKSDLETLVQRLWGIADRLHDPRLR